MAAVLRVGEESGALEAELGPDVLGDFALASASEWLETDGLGGWAGSSVIGAHTRRYHGLLVAATAPPVGRMVLLSRLDEELAVAGERHALAACRFPGAVHPRGFERQTAFRRGLFPVFDYAAGGAHLRKTVAAIDGEPTRLVLYELLAAPGPVELTLRPFYAGRDVHALSRANGYVRREGWFAGGTLVFQVYDGQPAVHLHVPGGSYRPGPDWWHDFELAREEERGFDFREDLFTPGTIAVTLRPGERLGVIASTADFADPAGRDAFARLAAERRRRLALLDRAGLPDPFCRALVLAADQLVVRRGAGLRTVIAGYPWFADWGRDSMIALPGLCLATRRFDDARAILRAFAGAVDRGMLPNRFPDGAPGAGPGSAQPPEYNTADASLWYFVAVHRYLEATGDEALARGEELLPVLEDILAWHRRGTRHGIREDADGLLLAGEEGVQLTWMDARVGDRVVTPRRGKPVEIEALWVNALAILAALLARLGRVKEAAALERQATRARRRFGELFWNETAGRLYDVVDGETRDASLRPNQLLALSLPFPLIGRERGLKVLAAVEAELVTPVGLRTLAPSDPRYCPHYVGGPAERDAAYHQGTVWPWLLGPYLTALLRLRGAAGRKQARQVLADFTPHLGDACLGSVSEIFDAEPPHRPRGAVAQAWSVGELLRAAVEVQAA